ncbi:hypothetical protein KKG48_01535 [Patescibacteria group bacterium]|nr:hypothetical protein [Patescibacteria group bacterium]MCG2694737.1 hypothetical protein [Candidatus Parcubacteria bacterium]
MPEKKEEKKSLKKEIFNFYFSNSWSSFFTITYLLAFLYSAVFYFDNVILAIKFIFYTLGLSTTLLSLGHLLWGIIFVITLIIPFSVSISAIFIFFNLWTKTDLQIKQKIISTIFVIVIIVTIIITMDDIIRNVAKQEPLTDFVQKHELSYRLIN